MPTDDDLPPRPLARVVQDGMRVISSASVTRRYLHGRFPLDLLAAFPWAWLHGFGGAASETPAARLLRFLRLLRPSLALFRGTSVSISVAGRGLSAWTLSSRFNPGLVRVIQLLMLLLCTCHWLGCVWWLTADIELKAGTHTAWQPTNATLSGDWGLQYAHAFLWGASMMTGMMPFDIVPTTLAETVVTIISIFFGLFISVVIISSSTTALQAVDSKKELARQKLERFTAFLTLKQVSPLLIERIVHFFEYAMTSTKSIMNLHELDDLPCTPPPAPLPPSASPARGHRRCAPLLRLTPERAVRGTPPPPFRRTCAQTST